jgi:predicted AAA+ superfamily ATPase
MSQYYAEFGVGIYGLYKAFRVAEGEDTTRIVPVTDTEDVTFDDLVGYEEQKKTLKENTEAFVNGVHANNVLLYGDSGTGKSTSVHALMHDYFARGLRIIDISKADRKKLPQVLAEIKKRNYRFIIFLDDLSFEENESDYKELKAMLEGALESRSDRVLIYATSNRRHLIRETWGDRTDMEHNEDIHRSDTMEEKLSLASRFGVTIFYSKPNPSEYLNIVRTLTRRNNIDIGEKELADIARKWELRHGGMSGRTASQLITWLRGEAARLKAEEK